MIVAIDGPGASGKGTLARRLAARIGLPHLDTGLLYRAAALRVLRAGLDPADEAAAAAAAAAIEPADLEDPELRRDEVAQTASRVSALPAVRAALLGYQRAFAGRPAGAVLDGRDIGTVVCPEADAKIFVTASPETRARRRFEELRQAGRDVIYAAVLQDLQERDERDRRRPVSPLVPADDAFVLDTSDLDRDAAFERALDYIASRTGWCPYATQF